MDKHVDILGLLYVVWGGAFLLAGAIVAALTVGAVALLQYAATGGVNEFAAGLTAVTFGTLAVTAFGWGTVHAATGLALRRHRPWSRTVALLFAVLDLVLLPFGTALGIYALWVLLNDEARAQFRQA